MQTLTDWKARRAGGRITITGTDLDTKAEVKVVGVDVIVAASPFPVATDKDGATFQLA